MSIDARIRRVDRQPDGSGVLFLDDRPANAANKYRGEAGQPCLLFAASPSSVCQLAGLDVWGGSGQLILGESLIANRVSCMTIEFVGADSFAAALEAETGVRA